MSNFIKTTFGGLSSSYYIRQLIFGCLLAAIPLSLTLNSEKSVTVGFIVFTIVSTFLYPYSRFVYEEVMRFITGDNVFVVSAVALLVAKAITMILCFSFAIFVAPIGLMYLYFYHRKQAKSEVASEQ